MKVYLASRYSRKAEMVEVAQELEALGHEVTSHWIRRDIPEFEPGRDTQDGMSAMYEIAREDLNDVAAADCLVCFTEPPRKTNTKGGRHVEFGFAMGLGKRVILVGPVENIFHVLSHLERYPDWPVALAIAFQNVKERA